MPPHCGGIIKAPQTSLIKSMIKTINEDNNNLKQITQQTKLNTNKPICDLEEILVYRFSLRVQLDGVHWDETIKLYTKAR